MRKATAAAVLFVCLSTPLFAGPRDDDSPGRANPIRRVVKLVRYFVTSALDDMSLPHP